MAESSENVINPKEFKRGLDLGPVDPVVSSPIEDMPLTKIFYVPLKQHKGSLCEPRVSTGDMVKTGQVLGESADPEAAPVHSPISGKVVAIGDHPDPLGQKILTVTIENDGADEWITPPSVDDNYLKKKISAMIRAVRKSGLVMAASGRPVHTLLSPPERPKAYIFLVGIPLFKPVQLLIANALDSEPFLAANRRLLMENVAEVEDGIKLLKKLLGVKQAVLGIADDPAMVFAAKDLDSGNGLKVLPFRNRYPLYRSELITTAVTGREVPWPQGDTRDLGTLVFDIEDIIGILKAVRSGQPQIDRVISVRGPEMTPRNLRVRLGTPIQDIVTYCGGHFDQAAKVVVGGLMDGSAQYTGLVPITKQTKAIHLLPPEGLVEITEQLCFKCGRCIEVCPMRILPNLITNYCEFGFFEEAESAGLFNCIECGCCAYVCPARRPLIHYVKHGKAELRVKRAAV